LWLVASIPVVPSVTIDAGTANAITHSGTGVFISGDVEASLTQITLAKPPVPTARFNQNELNLLLPSSDLIWLRDTTSTGFTATSYVADENANNIWGTHPPTLGGDPWVIAAVSSSTTPEPASLTLIGIGAFGMMGYAWRRRRQQAA
jgi:hypothetical protein